MYLFWHDLRRLARRGRPMMGRIVLGLILLAALAASFSRWFPTVRIDQLATAHIPYRRGLEQFGIQWVLAIASLQLAAILIVTPLVCGGALALERTRGTLDLLRLSHSTPMAIVSGKFAARFAYLASFVILGLPIALLGVLWSEVPPSLIAGCVVINVLVLSAAVGVSLWCSAETASAPAGIAASYVAIGLLAIVVPFVPWFNPAALFGEWRRGNPVSISAVIFGWAWVYIPLTAIGVLAAARRLSRDGEERAPGFIPLSGSRAAPPAELDARLLAPIETRRFAFLYQPLMQMLPRAASLRVLPTPPVREHPMLWKELYFGGNALAGELVRTAAIAVILIELLIGAVLLFQLMERADASYQIARSWRATLQLLAVNALGAALLSATAFAAGSITLEREQKTLDAILGLPDGRPTVLLTKWLGCMLRVRWMVVVAILPLIGGVSIGAFHGLPAAVLSLAIVVHLAFAAGVGVLCSVIFESSGRAILSAIAILLVVAVVPLFTGPAAAGYLGAGSRHPFVADLCTGLSPLSTWQTLLQRSAAIHPETQTARAMLNLVGYAIASGAALAAALWLFERKRS